MASCQAFAQAHVSDHYLRHNEVGCIFGNDSSAKPVIESSRIMDAKYRQTYIRDIPVSRSAPSTHSDRPKP